MSEPPKKEQGGMNLQPSAPPISKKTLLLS